MGKARKLLNLGLWFVLILVIAAAIARFAWYWHDRMSLHRDAPQYFDRLLPRLAEHWSVDDVSPYLSTYAKSRGTRQEWEARLKCYAILGRLKSHGRPKSSDFGLLSHVLYMISGRFEHGEATVFVWIDKVDGRIVVNGLYVSSGNAKAINDDSWCQPAGSPPQSREGDPHANS